MKATRLVLIFLFITSSSYSFAQNESVEEQCNKLHLWSKYYMYEKEDYEKAKQYGERVVKLWDDAKLPHNRTYSNYVNFLSLYYACLRDYKKAVNTALTVRDVMESLNLEEADNLAYASSLAWWFSELSNDIESEYWANFALRIINKLDSVDNNDHARTLTALAKCELHKGNYGEAINHYTSVLALLENNSVDEEYISRTLYGLSSCYLAIGRYKDAIKYGNQSLKYRNKDDSPIRYANQLLELARAYIQTGNSNLALDYVNESINIYKNNGEELGFSTALRTKSSIYYQLGEDSVADKISEEAYVIRAKSEFDNSSYMASSLVDIAQILFKQGKYNNSIDCFKQALQIIENNKGKLSGDYIITLQYLIITLATNNSLDEVKPLLSECLNLLKQYTIQNFDNFSYESRNTFWVDVNSYFEKMFFVATCVQYRGDSEMAKMAYDIALLSKGVLLSSQINIENAIRESHDKKLITMLSLLNKVKSNKLNNINKSDSINNIIDLLELDIVKRATQIKNFKWPSECSWKEVQQSLKEHEVAIEYFKTMSYYYAIVLRKEWETPKVIELFKNEMIDTLILKGQQLYHGDNSKYAYLLLFAKIRKQIKPGETVYFSPSGAIHQINLECLQDMDGIFLGDTFCFVRLSSTRLLTDRGKHNFPNKAILYGGLSYDVETQEMIFQSKKYHRTDDITTLFDKNDTDSIYRSGWNELPETKTEVEDIGLLFKERGIPNIIYSGSLGNEESFKNLTDNSISVIHLATHGFFFKNQSVETLPTLTSVENVESSSFMKSGLILSAGQKVWRGDDIPKDVEDGILFSEEISHLNLSGTDLITLSACRTGLGYINNDGVWGLQRAFKLAGVKSVIMSLWKVDDISTRLFMIDFYKNYLSGKSKQESFRLSQRYLREYVDENGNKLFSDPSYWAAFIMLDGY